MFIISISVFTVGSGASGEERRIIIYPPPRFSAGHAQMLKRQATIVTIFLLFDMT